jgi:DNA-directed RNA polymerase specialized sigma24 family protein
VDRIVRNKIANILEYRMAKKRGGPRPPVALDDVSEGMLLDGHADPKAIDLGLDVRNALAGLSPELQKTAKLLSTSTPSEVARMLGLTRGQVRQRMETIRLHLEGAGISPQPPKQQPIRRGSR